MTVTLVRLEDTEAGRSMVLGGRDHTRLDMLTHRVKLGSPPAREVVTPRPGRSGDNDRTTLHGGRAVSAEMTILSGRAAILDELSLYLDFRSRPWLCITDDEWPYPGERRVRLRNDAFDPGDLDNLAHLRRKFQLQWKAPDGVIVATEPLEVSLLASGGVVAGRTYPLIYPRVYAPTSGTGQVTHTNPGRTRSDFVARLYGPCAGPRLTNDDTGETITFSESLIIPAGEYVEVSTAAHTARYQSDPAASRLGAYDYSVSSWWQMRPGTNRIRYHPVSGVDSGCMAFLTYSPAWLYI